MQKCAKSSAFVIIVIVIITFVVSVRLSYLISGPSYSDEAVPVLLL